MIGHLGARVSALLDGQLSAAETERAWAHVHACHQCRDRVEHEGWVKTQLAGLAPTGGHAPEHLKGALLGGPGGWAAASPTLPADGASRARAYGGVVALGSGAVGAAVLGVLALGTAPADVSPAERRTPATQLVRPATTFVPVLGPTARPTGQSTGQPAPGDRLRPSTP